jgi:hypothetical protein
VKNTNLRELTAALVLLAVGAAFLFGSLNLRVGTARQMGAGYFPLAFSGLAIALALIIGFTAFLRTGSGKLAMPAWRPFVAVTASIAAFVLLMPNFGLVPAVLATVGIAATADQRSTPLGAALLALMLAAASWLIFVRGLGLPMRLWRWPM